MDEPFDTAEAAWLWTLSALIARRDGTRSPRSTQSRPCTPDDVVKCLQALYLRRRIGLAHARVLRRWGELGIAPSRVDLRDLAARRLWDQALTALEPDLMARGIVCRQGDRSRTLRGR